MLSLTGLTHPEATFFVESLKGCLTITPLDNEAYTVGTPEAMDYLLIHLST